MKRETNIKFLKYSIIALFNCMVIGILITTAGYNPVLAVLFGVNFVAFGIMFFGLGIFPRLNSFIHPNHEEALKNSGYAALCSLGLYLKD